ncbi:hypothetical protein B0T17DRAFT_521456 [Bombardia bombarda]|uniref:NADP-dependent oxidoreductase domain-containing protein n=1 Tax=Bombardia bombarda TaxID=252184 RepID=A0AA40CFZ1_9PEZI|nr:hypothetical protein B0T17DRAFT_521456 [Bombardia bombarda]
MPSPAYPQLIFGGSTIGDAYSTAQSVTDLLKPLKSLGFDEIDTAALYPVTDMGASERLLGEVGAKSLGFDVDTKILVTSKDANGTMEPTKIEKSVADSLGRLKFDGQGINVLHCHVPDFTTPIKDQASTLNVTHYLTRKFKNKREITLKFATRSLNLLRRI